MLAGVLPADSAFAQGVPSGQTPSTANLSALIVNGKSVPDFAASRTSYTVEFLIAPAVAIAATPADAAIITGISGTSADGSALSHPLTGNTKPGTQSRTLGKITLGGNIGRVLVTSGDGNTTKTYTITLNAEGGVDGFAADPEEIKREVTTIATITGTSQVSALSGLIRARLSEPSFGADSGGQYAVWVRGQYSSMDGDPTVNGITVDYDGDSAGLGVGVEKSTGRYVAGVAVNWLTTDLDISSSSDDTTLSKYEESLVMVAPYVSLRRRGRTFWFSGGYGIGDADATLEEGEGKASADVEVTFANAGADFVLSERGKNRLIGGLSVLGVRKVVDPLNFAAADVVIPEITLNTFRAQGELTYSRTIEAGAGRVVRPYIGVATLHDAGDRVNDDSHAMDLRGGVDFDGARFDVSLEASTELLREDHESWSVSGSARYQFAPSGRGASLSLDGTGGDASDIGLEGGYGMMMRQVHRDALLTPFAGIRHGSESGEFSSGMRLAVGDDTDADFRATRAFRDDEDTLKLTFRRTF